MIGRMTRLLRELDDVGRRRLLSIKEAEAREIARLLLSLEEVYEARTGERLFFGPTPLIIDDPKNAPERLRHMIHDLESGYAGLKLIVDALKLMDLVEECNQTKSRVDDLEGRLNSLAHLQVVRGDASDRRDEKVEAARIISLQGEAGMQAEGQAVEGPETDGFETERGS